MSAQTEMTFKSYSDMTIAEKVIYHLQDGPMTTDDFLMWRLYTFRNRISELRQKGYTITVEDIPGKRIKRYRLI